MHRGTMHRWRNWVVAWLTVLGLAGSSLGHVEAATSEVTVTVDRTIQVGVSKMDVGTTHSQNSLEAGGDLASVTRGKDLLRQGMRFQNQHIYGWGTSNPEPQPGKYDWSSLDRRVNLMRNTGATPIITLCCAPDWMTLLGTNTSRYSNLPPIASHYGDFAELARQIALRYPDVKYYVVWNEMKGLWERGSDQWDIVAYTEMYNHVYDALKAVNPAIQVGGPYLVLEGSGSKTGPWFAAQPITRRNWLVLNYWLTYAHGVDFIGVDRKVTDYHDPREYTDAERLALTGNYASIVSQLRARVGVPIWFIEQHFLGLNGGPLPYQTVGVASMLYQQLRGGAALTVQWQPEAQANTSYENLFNSTRQAGGGYPFPVYDVYKLFHLYFRPGTTLFSATSSSADVEVLASKDVTLLINKQNAQLPVLLNKKQLTLNPYEVRLLDAGGNLVQTINGAPSAAGAALDVPPPTNQIYLPQVSDGIPLSGDAAPGDSAPEEALPGSSACTVDPWFDSFWGESCPETQTASAASLPVPAGGWLYQFGTTEGDKVAAMDATIDAIYVSGGTYAALPGQTSSGNQDAFVARFDSAGKPVWYRQFGTNGSNYATAIAVDGGYIYVAGVTDMPLRGLKGYGEWDAFLRKYDVNGNEIWTRMVGTPGNDAITALTIDAGAVYLAGSTDGNMAGSNLGFQDGFVQKVDSNGQLLWTRQIGTNSIDYIANVAVQNGNVYLVGATAGSFPGFHNAGVWDAFVYALDSSGSMRWRHQFGTPGDDRAQGIAIGPAGIYVTGYVAGALPYQAATGIHDAFVRKYNPDGTWPWTRQFGTAADDRAAAVAVDATGVVLTGWTRGGFNGVTNAGNDDLWLRKYDQSGSLLWTEQTGGSGSDVATSVTISGLWIYWGGFTDGLLPGQTKMYGLVDAFIGGLQRAAP